MHSTVHYRFDVVDYVVFGVMLSISAITGLYFGCRSRYCNSVKAQDLSEYLTGSKSLKPFPVAMSLIGSYISGVTILGTAAEVYHFGLQYCLIAVAILISGAIIAFVYLPVLFKLQVNSSYEYLDMRFSREVRILTSLLFVMDEIMFLPIVIYVPSLAFNQVTGVNMHVIGSIVCIVCIFYTALGGLKAVVYTDTWQIVVMFISVIVIIILGTISIGGFHVLWDRCEKGGRIIFNNLSTSFYERQSIMAIMTGGVFYWTAFNAVHQTMVQRYLSLPTLKQSKITILLFVTGACIFVSICIYAGLLVYATYDQCDPSIAGRIIRDDQILPLYVMEKIGHLRGVPGLFTAGVFGAALSSLSVILNSTATVVLEDFIKGCLGIILEEVVAKRVVKIVILILGALSLSLLFVVEHMGGVLAAATALSAIAASTTFGIFTLGMLVPWSNSVGAIVGSIAGAGMSSLVAFGSQYAIATGKVLLHTLPVNVDLCLENYGINVTLPEIVYPDESKIFPLFRFSYHWITPIGICTTIIVGTIVSFIVGKTNLKRLDPEVISPLCHWLLPPECQRYAGTASKRVRRRTTLEDDIGLMQDIIVSNINLKETSESSERSK